MAALLCVRVRPYRAGEEPICSGEMCVGSLIVTYFSFLFICLFVLRPVFDMFCWVSNLCPTLAGFSTAAVCFTSGVGRWLTD